MGIRLIKIAVIYFVLGVAYGMFLGISQMNEYTAAHAHVNLIGWVSLALAGIIYHLFPSAGESRLGMVHFWLHNIGLLLMVVGFTVVPHWDKLGVPLLSVGGTLLTVGVICFAVNVFFHVKKQ